MDVIYHETKIFESIICGFLVEQFRNIFSQAQRGSTPSKFMEFITYAVQNIDSGAQEQVVYPDIRKAFDRDWAQLVNARTQ